MPSIDPLRFPIGKFSPQESYSPQEISAFVNTIEAAPAKIEEVFKKLSAAQLEMPYRPEGWWTARQVSVQRKDEEMTFILF